MTKIAEQVVSQLNKLLSVDRKFVETMVDNRIEVNGYTTLEDFVYMQETDKDIPTAGLIGVLNGVLMLPKHSRIAAVYDDNMKLTSFTILEK